MIKQKLLVKIIIFLISISFITRVLLTNRSLATQSAFVIKIIAIVIGIILLLKLSLSKINKYPFLKGYIFYGLFILLYSFFVMKSYDQTNYVFTVYLPSIALPIFSYLALKLDFAIAIFKSFIYISVPLSISIYFSDLEGMSDFTHYVSFVYIFILLIPYIKLRLKILVIILSIISFFYDLESRSNLLNISFSYLLLGGTYFKFITSKYFFNLLRKSFIYTPIILVLIAVSGVLNIFTYFDEKKDDITIASNVDDKKISLVNDSRTGVYGDALSTIAENNAYLFGLSAAGYHDTHLDEIFEGLKVGRLGSEVGILEYILRGGIIFVIIILTIHYSASRYGIMYSNNSLSKVLGCYVAYRFFFLFIEGQVSLTLSNIALFTIIGLCLNEDFRKLNNKEIKAYINKYI